MLTAIIAWATAKWGSLVGLVVGAFVRELFTLLSNWIASVKKDQVDHQAAVDQSQADMNKIENLPPNPTAQEESNAGSDALSHL